MAINRLMKPAIVFSLIITLLVSAGFILVKAKASELRNQPIEVSSNYDPSLVNNAKATLTNLQKNNNLYYVEKYATQFDVPLPLVLAVITQESGGSMGSYSKVGAVGIMQVMPDTAKSACSLTDNEQRDPEKNILCGIRYIKSMLDRFNGDFVKSIAAYNAGPGAVEKFNGIPPYKETQDYVDKVSKYYQIFGGTAISLPSSASTNGPWYKLKASAKTTISQGIAPVFTPYVEDAKKAAKEFPDCVKENELKDCKKGFEVDEWPDRATYLKFERKTKVQTSSGEVEKTTKFAIKLNDVVPPQPTEGLIVEPDKITTAAKLSWKQNPAEDLDKYKIYCFDEKPASLKDKQAALTLTKDTTSTKIGTCSNAEFELDKQYYFVVSAIDKKSNELLKAVDGKNIIEYAPVCCLNLATSVAYIGNKDCTIASFAKADKKFCLVISTQLNS